MAAASASESESAVSSPAAANEDSSGDVVSPSLAADRSGHDGDDGGDDEGGRGDDNDGRKAFLSRIPQKFDEDSIRRLLEGRFGEGCAEEVCIVRERPEADGDGTTGAGEKEAGSGGDAGHRGFGFVTFSSESQRRAAIEAGTVRGSARAGSKRRHTLYIRPVVRDDEPDRDGRTDCAEAGGRNVCFLWKRGRCPYGDGCRFAHEGEGGCMDAGNGDGDGDPAARKKKRQKCFSFKKSGKCKLGDDCPYSHDVVANAKPEVAEGASRAESTEGAKCKSEKDCVNWKNKGKCRKGDRCPYRHDESVRARVLARKKAGGGGGDAGDGARSKTGKSRRPLSVRVFGLNYSTTPSDVRELFARCGPIVEVTFPTFEDSGRSKGYCGVLFQSPKAVQKAVELDGSELHGRWLSVQEGRMFLRKWEEAEDARNKKRASGGGDEADDRREEVEQPLVGEYGQRVKRRKRHGFKD